MFPQRGPGLFRGERAVARRILDDEGMTDARHGLDSVQVGFSNLATEHR